MDTTFDLDELNAADTGEMVVFDKGSPTNWKWTFAGPGHAKTIAQSDRLSREVLDYNRRKTQAQANGKKWKEESEAVDEVRARNIDFVVERLLDWTPVNMGGKPFPFTVENARTVLSDRRKPGLLLQALEYLGDEASFTQRSATT